MTRAVLALVLALVALGAAAPAGAQEFPTKPVELVIPFGPGGSHDLTARALASVAHQYLGQPLLIVLRPGGGGSVGSQAVARARPDGYTLLFGGSGPNTTFALVQKAPIGPDHFVPVARINYSAAHFAVKAEAPWKSVGDVVEYARKNPGKLNFANTGTWGAGDLPMRMLARAAGFEYNNIPYDGGGPATLAVLGGHADATFAQSAQLSPLLQAGKMRSLGFSDDKHHRDHPGVPTFREQGFDLVFTMWRAVLAPKGTPPAVVDKLEAAFRKISEDKSFQALIKTLGDEVQFQPGKEFDKTWREEWEQHARIVAGAK